MNNTLDYYNKNAKEYFENTYNADMSEHYGRFLKYLRSNAYILDAGCGSGRDSRYFVSLGYRVKPMDASSELCNLAEKHLGIKVDNIRFEDINYVNEFDGVWACASLLHVQKNKINDVISKLYRALKENGVLYVSFKYGDNEREVNGRYFNDQNEDTIKLLLKDFEIKELWFSNDVRPGREDRWINVVAVKKINL